MTEVLPFRYYIPPAPQKLILGSFPCYNGSDYGDFFYSGSGRNHFWEILSTLTGMPATDVVQKKAICDRYHLALSDVALKIRRSKNNCSDSNLKIVEYNREGIHKCLASGVKEVFFTSRFVQKHFEKIFPGLKIKKNLLLSPSPAANRHIGGLEDYKLKYKKKQVENVFDYRVQQYKLLLSL
jgi:hypoxanthine-DNA glycosylase